MKNKCNCISVVSITKTILLVLLVILPNRISAQQSPSIQTGVTFQWSDEQTNGNLNLPATIQSVTIDGLLYNTFVVPTSYEMTRLGPDGHNPNRIRKNGANEGGNSGQVNWNTNAISAFQDKNLNHYFTANPNGRNICSNFESALVTDAQKQTIFYSPAIPSNEGGVIAVTERGGNNCFYIEAWGVPAGGGPEQKLGETFIRNVGNYVGCDFGPPSLGSDYWKSGRCNENGQTIGIGLFFLNDIAPTGSRITKIEFIGATRDHGDGKFFILQKYAVAQENMNCIDNSYEGNLNVNNTVPEGSIYSILSGPTPAGQSFTLNTDGTFNYVPNVGFTGDVEFEFEVCLPFPNNSVCDSALVSINFAPLPNIPEVEISCTSTNNFVITVTSPLGSEFEYSLNNGGFQSEPEFTNLTEGNYFLKVRNSFTECESISPITPIVLDNLELTGTVSDILCRFDSTGAIDITASGGAPPYTYSWSNGATTEDLSGLSAGTYTITITDTNACNIVSGDFTVSQPNEALDATITDITNVDCNGNDSGGFTVEGSGGSPPYNYSIDGGGTAQTNGLFENLAIGNYTIVITDSNFCIFNIDATIEAADGENPEITVPATIIIEGCSITDITNDTALFPYSTSQSGDVQSSFASNPDYNVSDDNAIESVTYIDVITSSNNCPITVLRTFTVTDTCDNTATTTQIITVQDTIAPTLAVPADITIECTEDETSANTGIATGIDNCSSVTITQSSTETDDCGRTKTITRTWTATDLCGNATSAVQIIIVQDTTPPTLTLPEDITIECGEDESSTNTGQAIGQDSCGGVRISQSDVVIPGCGNTKTILRTWRVTDNCGNPTTGVQTIIVEDTTPPRLVLPDDITIECGEDESSTNTGLAKAEDDCGGVTISQSDVVTPGCGNTKIIIRTWTTTDTCGNSASGRQTITVIDTTPPTFTVPEDITIDCDADATDLTLTGDVTDEADNCTTDLEANYMDSIADGNCVNEFVITRTWSLTDACNNTTTLIQTINVVDAVAPTFTVPADITIDCDTDPNDLSITGNVTDEMDNCSTGLEATFTDSITSENCPNQTVISRTWVLVDACNNEVSIIQTISLEDATAPTFTVPSDITIECDVDINDLTITGDVTNETDNCETDLEATYSDSVADGNCPNESVVIRTWSLIDSCDNSTTLIQTITVIDTTPPTFTVPEDITIDCDADVTDLSLTGDVTDEADNCTSELEASYTDSIADGNCVNEFVITRTWSLTDACNNTTTLIQTINVVDAVAPTFTVPADITIDCDVDPNDLNMTGDVTDETDNCASGLDATFSDSIADGSCANSFVISRTWSLTDTCDNTTSLVQTINVLDQTAPTFTVPENITVECDVDITDLSLTGDVTDENDNCESGLEATFTDTVEAGDCANESVITRTWSLTDSCDNNTVLIQTITVQDTTPPVFDTELTDITVECDAIPSTDTVTASDNCGNATVTVIESTTEGSCPNQYTLVRTWTAIDDCDNETIQIQTINVVDNTAPSFNEDLPEDMNIECDAVLEAEELTAIDNCGTAEVTFEEIITDGACAGDFIIERRWTATDLCGNDSIHTQIITIEDNTAPTLSPQTPFEENVTVSCVGIPVRPDLVFEDSCINGDNGNTISVVYNEENRQVNNVDDYLIIRTWEVTDDCGNLAVFTQTITVEINNVITATDADRCILDTAFDLFDLLSGDFDRDGSWNVVSGNATLEGSFFDPASVEELGVYTFKYAITEGPCQAEVDVNVTINDDCIVLPCGEEDVVISKTVTANGDGFNEFFTITGVEDCGFVVELQIFNRWGAEIYKSNNYQNDWNGESHRSSVGNSGKVPTGTYYYIINLRNSGLEPFAGPIYVATNK